MAKKRKITFITSSAGKFKDAAQFLKDTPIELKQRALDLPEIQEVDPIAIIEAKAAAAKAKGYRDFILEDASLTIHGLGKLPGPLTKWFQKELGNNGTYMLASRMGTGRAVATTFFAYCDARGRLRYFTGATRGTIVAPRGKNGFGWDAIFRPEGSHRTFGEMDIAEKAEWSMRGKALRKLRAFLLKQG